VYEVGLGLANYLLKRQNAAVSHFYEQLMVLADLSKQRLDFCLKK
jgi:hypothetical protein